MKIEAIQLVLPSRKVSNEDVLNQLKEINQDNTQKEFKNYVDEVQKRLIDCGAENRYWRAENETAIELLSQACTNALQEANCTKEDIDLLIYAGVGTGFTEPGNCYMVADCFGMNKVHCFDVLDACMSWARAAQIASLYLKAGLYKKVMIVNAEFNMHEFIYPHCWKFHNIEQLRYSFNAYTIGEGAAITILSEDDNDWTFMFASRPDRADLCTIPNKNFKQFYNKESEKMANALTGQFASYGLEMHRVAAFEGIKLLKRFHYLKYDYNLVLPHAATKTPIASAARALMLGNKIYFIFPSTGNLVSASIPGGLYLAAKEGKIQRGQNVLAWIASAGMSFAVIHFPY